MDQSNETVRCGKRQKNNQHAGLINKFVQVVRTFTELLPTHKQ